MWPHIISSVALLLYRLNPMPSMLLTSVFGGVRILQRRALRLVNALNILHTMGSPLSRQLAMRIVVDLGPYGEKPVSIEVHQIEVVCY